MKIRELITLLENYHDEEEVVVEHSEDRNRIFEVNGIYEVSSNQEHRPYVVIA